MSYCKSNIMLSGTLIAGVITLQSRRKVVKSDRNNVRFLLVTATYAFFVVDHCFQ